MTIGADRLPASVDCLACRRKSTAKIALSATEIRDNPALFW
jgi:hypothetical protein